MMRVLVINLSPPEMLAQLMGKIKAGHPDVNITVLTGHRERAITGEIMDWRAFSAARLYREIRARRFDAVVVAHGRDQYLRAGYWKALALSSLSGARRRRICRDARTPGRGLVAAFAAGIGGSCLLLAHYVLAALFASMLLSAVLVTAAVTDLTGIPAGRSKGRLGTR